MESVLRAGPVRGRVAGGVLKGFGVVFIVLGSLGILVGLLAAVLGAYVYNEEEGRGFFADRDKAEGGAILGIGGLALAGAGLVVLLLGILLYAIGASMARRELMQTLAQRQDAGAWTPAPPPTPTPAGGGLPPPAPGASVAPPPTTPGTPAAARPAPPERGTSPWGILAGVGGAALLVLLLLLLFQPGGPLAAPGADDPDRDPQVEVYTGNVQGVRTPLTGGVNSQGQTHVLSPRPDLAPALLRGALNWTAGPGSPTGLTLILEARESGEWVEKARGEGGPGLTVETPALGLEGDVRARIFIGGTGAGSQDYELTLTLAPL